MSYFDGGKHISWDLGASTGSIVGFRYEVRNVASQRPRPWLTVIAHGPDWYTLTDLPAGRFEVVFTVHDCFGRSDKAVFFIDVTAK